MLFRTPLHPPPSTPHPSPLNYRSAIFLSIFYREELKRKKGGAAVPPVFQDEVVEPNPRVTVAARPNKRFAEGLRWTKSNSCPAWVSQTIHSNSPMRMKKTTFKRTLYRSPLPFRLGQPRYSAVSRDFRPQRRGQERAAKND